LTFLDLTASPFTSIPSCSPPRRARPRAPRRRVRRAATMPVQQHVLNWLYSVLTSVRSPHRPRCCWRRHHELTASARSGISRCEPHIQRCRARPEPLQHPVATDRCTQLVSSPRPPALKVPDDATGQMMLTQSLQHSPTAPAHCSYTFRARYRSYSAQTRIASQYRYGFPTRTPASLPSST